MKTVGILGGMGPLATADLFEKIIRLTGAKSDRENIHVVIDSNTAIPDRTRAILTGGESPLPEMIRSAIGLERMGADFLIMPCNTAHYFYDEITPYLRIPMLHMIRETLDEVRRRGIRRAGLLATDGTCRSGVYANVFEAGGVELLLPDEAGQAEVMRVIYEGVKAGVRTFDTAPLERALQALADRGAETLILGCTELPLAFSMYGIDRDAVDPTLVLAAAAVREARG
ncbi:amino acid racemase [Eubacteriales bacterium OttesenSCG-928-A19]|nr:amino acid racemase [Eubacteriales bacterium OttesenSCG-928-A19]